MTRSSRAGLTALLAWEIGWWLVGKVDRRQNYARAKAVALRRGKPLLVVGEPDGEYPCGDVTVDVRPRSVCPSYVRADVQDLSTFRDKQFGAVLCSHVLEHVDDPGKALRELHRVADEVFIAYPRPWRLVTWLVPGHQWLVWSDAAQPDGLRFAPHPLLHGRTSHPTRYGTVFGAPALSKYTRIPPFQAV